MILILWILRSNARTCSIAINTGPLFSPWKQGPRTCTFFSPSSAAFATFFRETNAFFNPAPSFVQPSWRLIHDAETEWMSVGGQTTLLSD